MDLGTFETSLPVKNIRRTAAFYEGLGFERVDGGEAVRTITLRRGDCRVALFEGSLDPARLQLIFWQGDVEAIHADLSARGVDFRTPLRKADDGGASFMTADPDGHPIYFIHMPVHFPHDPVHAKPAPPRAPTKARKPDMTLGWFELSLDVADIARSVGFYGQLGFEVVDGGIPERHVTLANRDCRLGLYQGFLDPKGPQLIFWQGDVRATAARAPAESLDPRFAEGPVETEDGHVAAMLRDPDGQPIYLINIPGVTREDLAAG